MGNKIRAMRQRKGLTQQQLADILGITRQGVSAIERSELITDGTFAAIANALDCSTLELMELSPDLPLDEAYNLAIRENSRAYMQDLSKPMLRIRESNGRRVVENVHSKKKINGKEEFFSEMHDFWFGMVRKNCEQSELELGVSNELE